MKKIAYLLLAACFALVSCTEKETPVVLPQGLSVSGDGTEFSAPKAMVKVENGVWDIYSQFTAGGKVLVSASGESGEWLSFDVPAAKAGLCRLRVNGADKSWELVRINKVSLVVTEGGVAAPKEGNTPPIEASYAGDGVWTVEGLYIAKSILKYRFLLDTDSPASLKYWCAGWDNGGSAPSAHTAEYLRVRALGQKEYEKLYIKDNRACWMFPADKAMMLADFTISMNTAAPGQEIAYTSPHKGPKAVFIGDSITWQWARASRTDNKSDIVIPLDPLPSFMTANGDKVTTKFHPEFFTRNGYINKGVSGENTTQIMGRYQADVMDLDPHCVVIMAGTNDLAQGYSKDAILQLLATMAEQADEAGIKVVLCSVTPCNDVYSRLSNPNTKGAHIIALNKMIQDYAAAHAFPYCDYWTALVASDGLSLKEEYWLYDHLHPNPDAYTVMEGIIQDILSSVL